MTIWQNPEMATFPLLIDRVHLASLFAGCSVFQSHHSRAKPQALANRVCCDVFVAQACNHFLQLQSIISMVPHMCRLCADWGRLAKVNRWQRKRQANCGIMLFSTLKNNAAFLQHRQRESRTASSFNSTNRIVLSNHPQGSLWIEKARERRHLRGSFLVSISLFRRAV